MSYGKGPDRTRSLWGWGPVKSSSTPRDDIPAASSVHVTSAEIHDRHHSPEQVSDAPISGAPAVAHHRKPSHPRSHASGGGGGADTGVQPSSGRPGTASREEHTSEQTLDSSKRDRDVVHHFPYVSAAPKPEKQPSKKTPVPSKSENMAAVPGRDVVGRDTDAELPSPDCQTLRVYLRLGLDQQRKAFNTYSKGLRNAYGTARTKDEIQDMIAEVSKDYQEETDENIKKQNTSVANFIKRLEPQFRAFAVKYWAALFTEFTNFLTTSGIVAQEADAKSLKLTSKFWAVDKGLAEGVDKAYDRVISGISKVDRF